MTNYGDSKQVNPVLWLTISRWSPPPRSTRLMKDFICFLVHLIFYGCFLQCFSSAVKQTLDVLQAERHGERCFLCRDSWLKDVNAKIQGLTLFISAHLVIWSIDFSSPGLACSVFSEERG